MLMLASRVTNTSKPATCPVCGEPYYFRVSSRLADRFSVGTLFRHVGDDAYVYFHEITYEPH